MVGKYGNDSDYLQFSIAMTSHRSLEGVTMQMSHNGESRFHCAQIVQQETNLATKVLGAFEMKLSF